MQTPSTPSVGSLMGRLKAFGKGGRRAASETPGMTTSGGTITATPAGAAPDVSDDCFLFPDICCTNELVWG